MVSDSSGMDERTAAGHYIERSKYSRLGGSGIRQNGSLSVENHKADYR